MSHADDEPLISPKHTSDEEDERSPSPKREKETDDVKRHKRSRNDSEDESRTESRGRRRHDNSEKNDKESRSHRRHDNDDEEGERSPSPKRQKKDRRREKETDDVKRHKRSRNDSEDKSRAEPRRRRRHDSEDDEKEQRRTNEKRRKRNDSDHSDGDEKRRKLHETNEEEKGEQRLKRHDMDKIDEDVRKRKRHDSEINDDGEQRHQSIEINNGERRRKRHGSEADEEVKRHDTDEEDDGKQRRRKDVKKLKSRRERSKSAEDNSPEKASDQAEAEKKENRQHDSPERAERRKETSRSRRRQQSDTPEKSESRRTEKENRRRRRRHDSSEKDDEESRSHRRRRHHDNDDERRRRHDSDDDDRRDRRHSDRRDRRDKDNRSHRKRHYENDNDDSKKRREKSPEKAKKTKVEVPAALTRAGGAYIPPARLRLMMAEATDKSGEQYQRMNWDRLKKRIHGQVNKVNVDNIVQVVRELLQENVIRGKGLLARSIIQAQAFSPTFSHVYAALVAIINSKFPDIGNLILRRLVIQFKRAYKNNNKSACVTITTFLGHLSNQRVAHELLVLQLLVVLMEHPTDDSIEMTVSLLKVCGQMLTEVTSQGTFTIFEQLRRILENCKDIESRTQYMIEVLFAVRKEKFAAYPAIIEELDLIDEEDQNSHLISLVSDDGTPLDAELGLNVFQFDPNFDENEAQYDEIRKEIIGDADDSDDDEEEKAEGAASRSVDAEPDAEAEATEEKPAEKTKIIDMTDQEQAAFRRKVYLTIQSSLDFQEAAHKLIKNVYKPGIENELSNMIVDCCAQQRSYTTFYGDLAERFCKLRKEFQDSFERIVRDTYHTIHRFEITKLRNMSKLVAHLLATDSISWEVLKEIKMTEDDTTSSGRVYIKYIFQELDAIMGIVKLYERLNDPTQKDFFEGLFPTDHPKNMVFAINFFTLIGLSGLTVDLRKKYKKREKKIKEEEAEPSDSSCDSSSDSSSSSSDDSDSDSSSDSDSTSDSDSSSDSDKSSD